MERAIQYRIVSRSIVGSRTEQQDALTFGKTENSFYAIVCDGMGGMEDGAAASKAVVQTMKWLIEENADRIQNVPDFLLRCIDVLDEKVINLRTREQKSGCGTTIVAVVIQADRLYWLSVGDSRLYICRDGEMIQATRDHNYLYTLQELYNAGQITQTQYESESRKGEALTSYIGIGGVELFDICQHPFELAVGDILLLTTDGLYKTLSDNKIKDVLAGVSRLEDAADALISSITEFPKPNQDNTSFITIKAIGGTAEYEAC